MQARSCRCSTRCAARRTPSACKHAPTAYRETTRLESELERLAELASARERELDLLEHELAEIDALDPDEDEHQTLLARRERLRRLEALQAAAGTAAETLAPESSDAPGAAHLLAGAVAKLETVAGIDAQLDALAQRGAAVAIEAQDIAAALSAYREQIAAEDESLEAVEERLALLERVVRKHGGTIAAVLEHAEQARARREQLLGAEVAQQQTVELLAAERSKLNDHVEALRASRRKAATKLAAAVRKQLGALAMGDATFEIALTPTEPKANGADAAEFTIAPNPGVAAAPLREIASGGELSRVMLALASASNEGSSAASGGSGSTLVFDEVDAGIGGHTARAVGERLQALAKNRQLLCITHLPQIASLADRHFSVVKDTSGEPTITRRQPAGRGRGGERADAHARRRGAGQRRAPARRGAAQGRLKTGRCQCASECLTVTLVSHGRDPAAASHACARIRGAAHAAARDQRSGALGTQDQAACQTSARGRHRRHRPSRHRSRLRRGADRGRRERGSELPRFHQRHLPQSWTAAARRSGSAARSTCPTTPCFTRSQTATR